LTAPRLGSVALARQWSEFVEEAGKDSASQRRRATLVLRLLIEFLHDALSMRLGGTPRLSGPDDLRALGVIVGRLDEERILTVLERCLEADMQIDRRVQLVLIVEALTDALSTLATV
jgi:DNA polymerase-3 subunit delta'